MKQDGWTVESTADAPMRVRAWFESLDDALAYASRFGCVAWVRTAEFSEGDSALKERLADAYREMDGLGREIASLRREAIELRREKEVAA